MKKPVVTAIDLAREAGVDPKLFREALRVARLSWHQRSARWESEIGGPREADMRAVLKSYQKKA